MDAFIVYGGTYKRLRESMSGTMNEKEIEDLCEATQVLCAILFPVNVCFDQACILYCVELKTTRGGTIPASTL